MPTCNEDSVAVLPAKPETMEKPKFKAAIVWKNVIGFIIMHVMGVYGLYLTFASAYAVTFLWATFVALFCSFGITVGAHRLFTHRSYKANTGLKVALLMLQAMSGQNCCYIWARDHRQHHKHSDTVADPHDSTRGFFFSHIGWLMVRKHPAVIAAGKNIDMSDLEADPLVMWQKKYYKPLYFLFAIGVPVAVPYYCWAESFVNSFMIAYMLRYIVQLNVTWCVNSAAHLWGTQPYSTNVVAKENVWVAFFAHGEGWHNYHHAFPWDYRCAELGMRYNNNAWVIELCSKYGWATDLRSASKNTVMKKVQQTGDGTHHLWGFGDKDMNEELRQEIEDSSDKKHLWGFGDSDMKEDMRQEIEETAENKKVCVKNIEGEKLVKNNRISKREARAA